VTRFVNLRHRRPGLHPGTNLGINLQDTQRQGLNAQTAKRFRMGSIVLSLVASHEAHQGKGKEGNAQTEGFLIN
jgi:hypothetical protein